MKVAIVVQQPTHLVNDSTTTYTMSLQKLTAELYQLFDKANYIQCQKLLAPIKIELIKHNLLVPLPSNTKTNDQVNDLRIAERILEIGLLSSLLSNNYQNFENYFSQLRPFYSNEKLHPSANKQLNSDATKIISLYLLYLLTQGLISKFHIELEVIYNSNRFDIEKDQYLNFPINLERNLMEGNYIKIWKLLNQEKSLPCPEYKHFIGTLTNALRFEIAKSLETAYETIPISNCKSLLYFPQEQSDQTFEQILKEELDVNDWVFKNGTIYFNNQKKESNSSSDNLNIIKNTLSYAEQIESII